MRSSLLSAAWPCENPTCCSGPALLECMAYARFDTTCVKLAHLSLPSFWRAPSGWAAVLDKTHDAYYYHNRLTDETTWIRPEQPVAQSPAEEPTAATAAPAAEPTPASTSSKGGEALRDGEAKAAATSDRDGRGEETKARKYLRREKAAREKSDEPAAASGRSGREKSKKSSATEGNGELGVSDASAPTAGTATAVAEVVAASKEGSSLLRYGRGEDCEDTEGGAAALLSCRCRRPAPSMGFVCSHCCVPACASEPLRPVYVFFSVYFPLGLVHLVRFSFCALVGGALLCPPATVRD